MQLKRVLVTGAGGFIGRWSVPPLLRDGFEVHATLSRHASGSPSETLQGASLHAVDVLNERDVDALLAEVSPTHLLHFAWIATPGVYWHSPENSSWLAASQHLLRRFREQGGQRAVLAGSCAEYDWSQGGVCHEATSPLADITVAHTTPYTVAKLAMQSAAAEFSRRENLSSAWGRIFFQYGPGEHPERLVPSVIRSLLENRPALCTHGRQVRSFLHVADLGAAFAALLQSSCQGPVNMGSDEGTTLAALVERIAAEIGRPDLLRLGAKPAPATEPPLLLPDIRRLRDEVGWRPRYTLSEGLLDTIEWWRNH
jgi:nucleoside-diphosphate-sugar epimerase